jgi:hypothetical protein
MNKGRSTQHSLSARHVKTAIKNWKPSSRIMKEKNAEQQLTEYLKKSLKNYELIKQQYKFNDKLIGDIAIIDNKEKIVIEIKHNLNRSREAEKLKNQVIKYKKEGFSVIVLLIGDQSNSDMINDFPKDVPVFIKKRTMKEIECV